MNEEPPIPSNYGTIENRVCVDLIDMNPNAELQHANKGITIEPTQRVYIETYAQGILIRPVGYGEYTAENGRGTPIVIEQCNGRISVIAWSDINKEDPTHIIDMEQAKEECRNDI